MDAAFEPVSSMTAAFVVTWNGRLVAERYGPGISFGPGCEARAVLGRALADTGALLAYLHRSDRWHERCRAAFPCRS